MKRLIVAGLLALSSIGTILGVTKFYSYVGFPVRVGVQKGMKLDMSQVDQDFTMQEGEVKELDVDFKNRYLIIVAYPDRMKVYRTNFPKKPEEITSITILDNDVLIRQGDKLIQTREIKSKDLVNMSGYPGLVKKFWAESE